MKHQPSDIYRTPEVILADLIRREARGEGPPQLLQRAVVLAVDVDGGLLQNPSGGGSLGVIDRSGRSRVYPAVVGPSNPRGSIKARVLTNGLDRLLDDEDVRVFWPMMPHDQVGLPVSPGEHVYVLWEDGEMEHGLWLSRVSGQDSANSFAGVESYTAPQGNASAMDSFEPNPPEYPRDDDYAGEAPPTSAMGAFGDS